MIAKEEKIEITSEFPAHQPPASAESIPLGVIENDDKQ